MYEEDDARVTSLILKGYPNATSKLSVPVLSCVSLSRESGGWYPPARGARDWPNGQSLAEGRWVRDYARPIAMRRRASGRGFRPYIHTYIAIG